jgi:hypothetical protein
MEFLQERFISLDVCHNIKLLERRTFRHFGHSVRTRWMFRRRHFDRSSKRCTHGSDFFAVGGDHSMVQDGHRFDPPPNPLDQWLTEQRIERFIGEAGRGQPRRNDAENAAAQRSSPGHEAEAKDANITPVKLSELA